MAFAHSPKIVTNGLVYALDAANTKSYPGSGTAAYDLTGTATSSTLQNAVAYTAGNGGAFDFDGTNDYIGISFSSQPATSQITIIGWVYPDQDATTNGRTRGSVWGGPGAMYMGLWPNGSAGSSAIHVGVQTASGRPTIQTGTIYTNQWSMLSMAYNGSSTTTYLNTSVVSTSSQTGNILSGTGYYVGTYAGLTDSNHNFPGKIAHALMYNKALSAEEIQQNYNALKGRFGL